jgi:cyclopropane-fatty-acyl-phospholipid synthase
MHAPLSQSISNDPAPRGGGWLSRALAPFFRRQLDRIDAAIARGSLTLTLPDGTARLLGGREEGPVAVVDLRSWRALLRLAVGGSIGWYQAWASGEWTSPDPVALFALFGSNRAELARQARANGPSLRIKRLIHAMRRNDRRGSRRNIHFHYDLGNDFYRLWLDPGMTYSSALFAAPDQSLEEAQQEKLAAILARTATRPGDEILEIGSGWGSFAELAVREGRTVHGITLSTEQKAWAETRVPRGARFTLTDYRDVTGSYDAVASIEMAEAVGREYWPAYLDAIARALKPGGHAALQIITFDDAFFEDYAANVDFIQAYVFPGGMLLSEARLKTLAEARGLSWRDRVSFGPDYAETLRRWREAFDAAVEAHALPENFDNIFKNLWRYYLMYCEGGFRGGGIDVVQLTLVKEERI